MVIQIDGEAQAEGLRNELSILVGTAGGVGRTGTIQTLQREISDLKERQARVVGNPAEIATFINLSNQIAAKENELAAAQTRATLIRDSLAAFSRKETASGGGAAQPTPIPPLAIPNRGRTNAGLIQIEGAPQIAVLTNELRVLVGTIQQHLNTISEQQQTLNTIPNLPETAELRKSVSNSIVLEQNALALARAREKQIRDSFAAHVKKNPGTLDPTIDIDSPTGAVKPPVVTLPGDPSLPGRPTRPAGERPRQQDPHVVVRAATCTAPEQRVYFDEDGTCYQPLTTLTEEDCPVGWRLVNEVVGQHGCSGVGAFTGKLPLCENTLTQSQLGRQQQFDCCTKNTGGNVNCPPGMCKAAAGQQASAACIDAFRAQCVDSGVLGMANKDCQQFALDNFSDATVDSAVRRYCTSTNAGRSDAFCACVNASDASLCAEDDKNCFAELYPGLTSQAICMAPQCTQRKPGVFVPRKEGGCAPICLSQINAVKGQIRVGESLNLITFCGDQLTPEQIDKVLQETGMTREEFNRLRAANARGDLAEVERINQEVQRRLGVTNPTTGKDAELLVPAESSGLPQWAIITLATVGSLLVLGLIAGLVYWLVTMQQSKKKESATKTTAQDDYYEDQDPDISEEDAALRRRRRV